MIYFLILLGSIITALFTTIATGNPSAGFAVFIGLVTISAVIDISVDRVIKAIKG